MGVKYLKGQSYHFYIYETLLFYFNYFNNKTTYFTSNLALVSQGLEQEGFELQAAHLPSFDFRTWRMRAQPAYPKIAAPIIRFAIIFSSSFLRLNRLVFHLDK